MIREMNSSDLTAINSIGSLIKNNFVEKYDVINNLKKDYFHIYVYVVEKEIAGFLQIENHYEITDVINIAVDQKYQNKGIGTSLINHLISNTAAEKIMLEVNENNVPAIRLYKKVGFKEIHRRKKYYENDDAIIMERNII